MKKLADTTIYNDIMKECNSQKYSWDSSLSEDMTKITFESIAVFLGMKKKKTEVQGFELRDVHGNFHFGAFVKFMPSPEDETKGNFVLTYTFDEDDMKESCDVVSGASDMLFKHVVYNVASRDYGIEFLSHNQVDYVMRIMVIVVDCIKTYMRQNIKIDPQIELDEYFSAAAELEGDKVYVSITPSAILKQHIKNDASIEETM